MAQRGKRARINNTKKLLQLEEQYNLYHVKTLPYTDIDAVLTWLDEKRGEFTFRPEEDPVTVVNRFVQMRELRNVSVMDIYDEPQIEGIERLVVHIKQQCDPVSRSCVYDAMVLYLVIQCNAQVPYSLEVSMLIKETQKIVEDPHTPLFFRFAKCPPQNVEPISQQTHPVIDGFLPSNYNTTKPRAPILETDTFGRIYKPLKCTAKSNPWSVYVNLASSSESKFDLDIEKMITTPDKVLGRGGFGVTVSLNKHLVAKTNMFPDMLDFSIPFIEDEFSRYIQIAAQTEEAIIGVSMKHANILRTFGALWVDIEGYQLGGRSVLVMERALFSLQEFMFRIKGTAVVPAIELDTLRGLDYLRSRAIQHRDFTFRNVLVCHQPDRKPVPFAFKISDFGTACTFSTPDQQRGNHTASPPEMLWGMIAATGSDVFSWYCVMWELYNDLPLLQYRGSEQGYCKKTYAENLSNLVGIYSPEKNETFELAYMKTMNARALHAKHKDRRPTVQMIGDNLHLMGLNIADKNFVAMGVLCITLFPQERWSPSKLLTLLRYQCLSQDISDAQLPVRQMPLSMQVGEYRPTAIIVADDCSPARLTELVKDKSSPITVIKSDVKYHYGIDIMRLAPDLIQPYEWYSKKVKELECLYKSKYKKCDTSISISNAGVTNSRDPAEGALSMACSHPLQAHLQPVLTHVTDTPNVQNDVRGVPFSELTTEPVRDSVDEPHVIIRGRRVEGEVDTVSVFVKSPNDTTITCFNDNVILLSQRMTRMHPLLFAGPRDGLCKSFRCNTMVVFQYAQLFEGGAHVGNWNTLENPNSGHAFLLQVFLTLKAALDVKALPTHMTDWRIVLISNGAVMIDIVSYLSRNFNKPEALMFGDRCELLVSLCNTIVAQHLPDSNLAKWLCKLRTGVPALHLLTKSINWLQHLDLSKRKIPYILTLEGNFFTFRDYSSDIPNWLPIAGEGEDAENRSSSKLLVYGNPKPIRGNQTTEGVGDTNLHALVRNIILRMKVKLFKSLRLEVTALDCTQGLIKVTLNNAALSEISSIGQLNGMGSLSNTGFTHDAISLIDSKWAPVIMFTKRTKHGPVQEFTVDYYTITILVVLLSPQGPVRDVRELFQSLSPFSVTDY